MPTHGLQFKDQLEETGSWTQNKIFRKCYSFFAKQNKFLPLLVPCLSCSHPQNRKSLWNFPLWRDSVVCYGYNHHSTPSRPPPFFYSQALKILPACLKIFKIQGFLTGTGVANQNRVGGEKNQKVKNGQVLGPQTSLRVPMGLQLKVAAIMRCVLLERVTWQPHQLHLFSSIL